MFSFHFNLFRFITVTIPQSEQQVNSYFWWCQMDSNHLNGLMRPMSAPCGVTIFLVDRVRFELTMSGYLTPYVIADLVLYRPNSYHRYFNDPIFWSPELDSNQRSPPSKGGSLTRLAHRERFSFFYHILRYLFFN